MCMWRWPSLPLTKCTCLEQICEAGVPVGDVHVAAPLPLSLHQLHDHPP